MDKRPSSVKLGETPVPRLLAAMSAPAITSMLVQALYNVVDSVFVSRISEDALTALSIAFPMQMLVNAFSIGLSTGTASLVSRKLGEDNRDGAVKLARNGLFIAVCLSLFWLASGWLISSFFPAMFSPSGSDITEYATQYLFICVTFAFGHVFEIYFNKLMQSMGIMTVPMVTQLIGAVTNIILDPLFIFGVGSLPAMGVRGAAIATVIGQVSAMIYALTMFIVKKHELKFGLRGFRPSKEAIGDIVKLGFPVTVLNSISSITTTLMNGILMALSKTAVAVLGVYFKLQSFVFMPVLGLNQGALPIMAYNYGADDRKRFMKTYGICIGVAVSVLLTGTIIFQTATPQLLSLFAPGPEMMRMGTRALRLISLSFIPGAFAVTTVNMFQSIGHGVTSMLMSLLRRLGFLLPIAFVLARTTGLEWVWIAYPVAELATVLLFTPVGFRMIGTSFERHAAAGAGTPPALDEPRQEDAETEPVSVNDTPAGPEASPEEN